MLLRACGMLTVVLVSLLPLSAIQAAESVVPGCKLIVASAVIEGNAEIVLLDTAQNELLNLTRTLGDEQSPAWSPDGGSLVWAAQRNGNWDVFLQDLARGTQKPLTSTPSYEGFPSFSPDGKRIAFESHAEGDVDIYVMSAAGGNGTAVISELGADVEPTWAGNNALLYSTWRDEERHLALRNLASGSTTLLTTPHEEPSQAAVSRDGKRVAYVGTGEATTQLWVRDLTNNARSEATVLRHSAWPFWGAAGQLLALELVGGGEYSYPTGWQLVQRATPTDAPVPLDALPALPGLNWQRPSCAPAGTKRPAGNWQPLAIALVPQLALAGNNRVGSTTPRGVSEVADIDAPSNLFANAVVGSFTRLRAQVKDELGYDFLFRFGDTWRSVGNSSGGMMSWHKTGRAFDVPHAYNVGGERRLYLARQVLGDQTYFRIYLKTKKQDGSQGAPMRETVFEVLGRQNDPTVVREGGFPLPPPAGYFIDFTALAEREGWTRISGLTAPDGDWRKHYNDIEYWHYERRDNLRWYEAMALVQPADRLNAVMTRPKLRDAGYTLEELDRAGIPK